MYQREVASVTLRTCHEVESLFSGFELVEPGVVWIPEWRLGALEPNPDPSEPNAGYAGVARKH
ncbi:MAG: SAM-dependent methyltransferase [Pseudonocardiaceae bacterium]